MNLMDRLNKKLETLIRDFNDILSDLEVCSNNIKISRSEEEKQQILDFINILELKVEEKKQEIIKTIAKIQLASEVESKELKHDFTEDYPKEETQLSQNVFNTSLYNSQENSSDNDLDEPRTR